MAVKKIVPSKPALKTTAKLRPFIWKRVILDREGTFAKNGVANSTLTGLDNNWKGKEVIWFNIDEFKGITLAMVEELFTAKAEKEKPVADAGAQKVGKRTFFPGDKAQGLFIVTSRLPPADIMIRAVDALNERSVSTDNLQALLKAWPFEEFDDLMAEHAQDKEAVWEKAEAYFIKLGEKPKFDLRLKVWLFKIGFDPAVSELLRQQETLLEAFRKVLESKKWRQILGAILAFGNCLNAGNKSRGQADGFSMGNLGTSMTLKDAKGNSILKICCQKLFEEDNEFAKYKEDFKEVYDAIKLSTEDLQKKTDKLKADNKTTKSQFSVLEKSDETLMDVKFGKQISKWLETTDERVAQCEENMAKVLKQYEVAADLLMLEKKDEMRSKSDKFFKFFAEFFDQIQKCMPKVEEPKKRSAAAA